MYRNSLVQQRIVERNQQKLLQRQFDYSKCPLLSRPGEQYLKAKLTAASKSTLRSLSLFNDIHFGLRSSSSFFRNSSVCMIYKNSSLDASDLNGLSRDKLSSQSVAQPKSCLRNIYSSLRMDDIYENLFILDAVADIFVSFSVASGNKNMNHTDFRMFVK